MNKLIQIGKKRTILISISVLLLSIWSIYFEQSSKPEIDYSKLTKQIIRFILTIGLLYMVYIGKNWARILSIILFSLTTVVCLGVLFGKSLHFLHKIPFLTMIFVYSVAIYHFLFSQSFKAFWNYQKQENHK